jgi:pyrimidine-nucleoside phosphorylase
VGNALEVREAIDTLRGEGPEDFAALVRALAVEALLLAGKADGPASADRLLEERWRSGAGLEKLRQLVDAQGGEASVVDDPERLPRAPVIRAAPSAAEGFVEAVNTEAVGRVAMALGAGRLRKGDPVDHAVGLVMAVRVGDRVRLGQPLAEVHARSDEAAERATRSLRAAITLGDQRAEPAPLLEARLSS